MDHGLTTINTHIDSPGRNIGELSIGHGNIS